MNLLLLMCRYHRAADMINKKSYLEDLRWFLSNQFFHVFQSEQRTIYTFEFFLFWMSMILSKLKHQRFVLLSNSIDLLFWHFSDQLFIGFMFWKNSISITMVVIDQGQGVFSSTFCAAANSKSPKINEQGIVQILHS